MLQPDGLILVGGYLHLKLLDLCVSDRLLEFGDLILVLLAIAFQVFNLFLEFQHKVILRNEEGREAEYHLLHLLLVLDVPEAVNRIELTLKFLHFVI